MTTLASIHEHPEEWLAAALANGLSREERRALDEHLAGCERCRALGAEFAALDETLQRDFPAAVGPAAGFEARLLAGFRRRHGRGGERLARLRALLAWLVRQRGVRFAGVAAALVALVGIGQRLTRSRSLPPGVGNDVQIESKFIEVTQNNLSELGFDGRFGFTEADDMKDKRAPSGDRPETFLSPMPVPDINAGRELYAASPAVNGSLSVGNGRSSISSLDRSGQPYNGSTLTLATGNTGAGNTNFKANTLDASAGNTFISAAGTIFRSPTASSTNQDAALGGEVFRNADSSFNFVGAPVPSPAATSTPDAPPASPDVRKLIRNARAELEVASFDAAVDAITAEAARDGGFLDTRNSARGANGKVSGTLVVKVLPENLDRFLAGLRTLGELKNQTIQTEDVTKDYFDTDARLRNARRMEDRLLKMLDEVKGKLSEVLQVEKELARVRADIETMQGQLKLYDAQVRFATVTLSVYEKNLDQPAAFLLRETATLSLLTADVEKAAAEARRIADAAHAQTLRSELSRDVSGHWHATLRLLVATDASDGVIAQVKALGRVEDFHLQDERTAQNGGSAAGIDSTKVEHAPVAFDITISHDEQVGRRVRLALVAPDTEGAFEKARAAALAAGGEVVNADVSHPSAGHTSAALTVRVPAAVESGLLASLQALGRAGKTETRRTGNGTDADNGPVLIQLTVADTEPAVQDTVVEVQTGDVERRAADIKREAATTHADVEGSDFSSEGDGRQHAGLKFRLPLSAYPEFIERVRALGTVKQFTVRREDRPDGDANAPAAVELSLYSEGPVVNANSGLGATVRRTFGQGVDALAWSVQMIGVALAFLAPWTVLLGVIVVGVKWRQRATRSKQGKMT